MHATLEVILSALLALKVLGKEGDKKNAEEGGGEGWMDGWIEEEMGFGPLTQT